MTREKKLQDLLEEAMPFLAVRGTYFYNSQRRGVAADLLERIEKALETPANTNPCPACGGTGKEGK